MLKHCIESKAILMHKCIALHYKEFSEQKQATLMFLHWTVVYFPSRNGSVKYWCSSFVVYMINLFFFFNAKVAANTESTKWPLLFTGTGRSYDNTFTIRCVLAVGHLCVENSCCGCQTILWEDCGHAQTERYSNLSSCLWDSMATNLWHHRATLLGLKPSNVLSVALSKDSLSMRIQVCLCMCLCAWAGRLWPVWWSVLNVTHWQRE